MRRWQNILQTNMRSWEALVEYLELPEEMQKNLDREVKFSLNIPLRLLHKMEKGTLEDPLLRQFVPLKPVHFLPPYFSSAPCKDELFVLEKKLLKKYDKRSLLLTTKMCAMHCRYCFRQEFEYEKNGAGGYSKELELIRKDPTIYEVILSGGDPLSLADAPLFSLLRSLDEVEHLQVIRFHTRFPIGIPERIDDAFLKELARIKKRMVFVLHVNHPKELGEDLFQVLVELKKLSIPLLCQSVLLKGVNDSIEVLEELMMALFDHHILPYYLHQLDPIVGAQDFEVSIEEGQRLYQALLERLPGYLVPRYVQEIAGRKSKVPIQSLGLA